MDENLSGVCGRLRGHAPPPDSVLQRLRDISDHFRVSWTPAFGPRPARWWVHEVRPKAGRGMALRQAAGRAKLERISRWIPEAVDRRLGEVWEAEAMADGLYLVGEYREPYFGTDAMFRELLEGNARIAQLQAQFAIEAARDAEDRSDVTREETDNPEFRQYVRDWAEDAYPQIMGRKTVLTHGSKEMTT